jgi:DNA-binding MarR family transcriptional regulator
MDRRREDAALLAVARATVGVSTRAADQLGQVSVVQLRALTVLRELGPASLVQLAEGVGVTASTTSRLVDRLVAAGFAERRPSPESRRQIELRLTPEGEATLDRYDELRLEVLRAALDRVPDDHREAVADALAEFAAATRALPERVSAGR